MQEVDISERLAQLEKKIEQLRVETERALNQAKADTFKISSRLEAIIRHMLFNNTISVNNLLEALNNYSEFRNTLIEISKLESIPEKIERAKFYNNTDKYYFFKIYADDLNLRPFFEKNGGPSKAIAKDLLDNFEKSIELFDYLYPYANN